MTQIHVILDAIGNLDNVAWCMSREMTQEVEKYMRRLMGNLTSLKAAIQNKSRQREEEHLDTLGSLALSDDLANDTIRIALNIVGINPNALNQFERASAMLDMAQEYNANRESLAHYEYVFDDLGREIANVRKRDTAWANGRGYNGKVYKEMTA